MRQLRVEYSGADGKLFEEELEFVAAVDLVDEDEHTHSEQSAPYSIYYIKSLSGELLKKRSGRPC